MDITNNIQPYIIKNLVHRNDGGDIQIRLHACRAIGLCGFGAEKK